MSHKHKRAIFPLFQEPETKVAEPTAPAHYWPPEALPFAYSIACIDIVLQRSQEAKTAYHEAIRALELPGCQALIKEAKVQAPDTNAWSIKTIKKLLEKGIKSLGKGKDIPSLPGLTTIKKYKDNADILHFFERVSEFIRIGFNRQADLAEKRPKVIAGKAPNLFGATVIKLITEYCKVKLENWKKYRPDDINDIVTSSDPTTRAERDKVRLKKGGIRQVYKLFKWVLHRNAKFIKYADQWYKCRVNPGSIEDYINDLAHKAQQIDTIKFTKQELKKFETTYYPDRGRIENNIAPCDEATGYPRKWRK